MVGDFTDLQNMGIFVPVSTLGKWGWGFEVLGKWGWESGGLGHLSFGEIEGNWGNWENWENWGNWVAGVVSYCPVLAASRV